MNYKLVRCFLLLCILLIHGSLAAQSAREVSIEVTAALNKNNHTELRWTSDTGVIRYFVYKRPHVDSNWILLDSMSPSIRQYGDTNSLIGQSVEYRIAKKKNNFSFTGNGYIKAGFLINENPNKGKILVLLDSNLSIPTKLSRLAYFSQLEREGFVIIQRTVLRTESVANIKSWIFQQYQKDSNQIRCVLIIGHVTVPYSGDMSPDGHTDHRGAWPADNYYGSFYQNWTDVTVNRITASRVANRNSPGDGKFDLSRLNPVGTTWKNTKKYQLPVGRIDFYDMPAFGSDTLLLIRYFQKNLAFRSGKVSFSKRALIDDNFGYFGGEAFASGGYRNFSPFFGDSIVDADYAGNGRGMKSTDYLWSYGCGGGSYTSCSGVSSSNSFVGDSLLNPFTMVFGSYFGDWDNQNNFLRAPIASKGWGLASVWAGRPYWMMHEAALGAPLYQCVKTSYNCANIYNVGSNGSGVHVAFMGDPTLRVFPISNIQGLKATTDCSGKGVLNWNRPNDSPDSVWVDEWQSNNWNRIVAIAGSDTAFIRIFSEGIHKLSLRSKKLMKSASGSWWDVGARSTLQISVNHFDTLNISADKTMKCSGDTFRIKGLHKKLNSSMLWTLNGQTVTVQDSMWNVASNGQGNVKVALQVTTDAGCLSADSLVLFSVPSNDLKWNGKTDSTIQVKSKLNLPIRWYRNDTLIAGESDTILRISKSGIYRAETLSYGLCKSVTDTLFYRWPDPVLPVNGLSSVSLCDQSVVVTWRKHPQNIDSVVINLIKVGDPMMKMRFTTRDTFMRVSGDAGSYVVGVSAKMQVVVVSGLRWDFGPVAEDTVNIWSSDTLTLIRQNDSLLLASSVKQSSPRWYRNDTLLIDAAAGVLRPKSNGVYRVCSVLRDSCTYCSDTLQWFARVLGVRRLSDANGQLKLFPNPTSGGLTIKGLAVPVDVRWRVFDLQGKFLLGGLGDWVDVSTLKEGCYVIHVVDHGSFVILKQ